MGSENREALEAFIELLGFLREVEWHRNQQTLEAYWHQQEYAPLPEFDRVLAP